MYLSYGVITSIAMCLYLISNFVFNLNSPYKVPFDKWSKTDLVTIILITVSILSLNGMTFDNYFSENDQNQFTIIAL